MQKIYFDNSTYIWKGKLNLNEYRSQILNEAYEVIESQKEVVKSDGFGYKDEWKNIDFVGNFEIKNKLDLVCQLGVDKCKQIWNEESNTPFNKINTDAWVNVVRSKNPVQIQFKHEDIKGVDKFHTHTEINRKNKQFYPNYTYVYYIQMPDVMEGDDGILLFRSKENKEYFIKPEEDDLIIMPGYMPHAPNNAPKANLDRVVMAGNVGFEYIKKQISLF